MSVHIAALQFDILKKRANDFNENLDKFKEVELYKIVSEYLKDNGFKITKNVIDNPLSNTIIKENLLSPLKSLWFHNTPFEVVQWEGEKLLRINSAVIASSENDAERRRIEETCPTVD